MELMCSLNTCMTQGGFPTVKQHLLMIVTGVTSLFTSTIVQVYSSVQINGTVYSMQQDSLSFLLIGTLIESFAVSLCFHVNISSIYYFHCNIWKLYAIEV